MLNTLKAYINDQYGSKRGLLACGKFYWVYRFGGLRHFEDIDFDRVKKLVFVCSGNICRSPLGEHYARHLGLSAESYGLDCRGGDSADPRTIEFGRRMGLDMSRHITRNIKNYSPSWTDLVVAMEPWQAEKLKDHVSDQAQITLSSLWLEKPRAYLHDPFSSTTSYFELCGKRVTETVDFLYEKVD